MNNTEHVQFPLSPKKYVLHFIWHDFTLTQNMSTETSQNSVGHNKGMTMFSCNLLTHEHTN